MLRFAFSFLVAAHASIAAAQAWPAKPVRIVLQFPPGGSTDVVARVLAQALTQSLGQPVLVENKPGADGAIAAELVMKSEPDGYTVFLASNTPMMQVPLLRKNPPYDPVANFTPVSLVGRYVYVLVVNPALPVRSGAELVAYARANPGKLNYASYSGVTQLMHARLKAANMDMSLVPYKGEAPSIADIIGGHIHLTYATPSSTFAHIRDGKLRALATLLPARGSLLPEVPTAEEAGLPPLTAGTWAAIFGPAKMPPEITARLNREINAAIRRTDVKDKIDKQGFELAGSTPEEMGAFVKEQLQAWSRAFREAGIHPE
jgi:tripartite-type tricarboxylate transporter receptor subunit TctC